MGLIARYLLLLQAVLLVGCGPEIRVRSLGAMGSSLDIKVIGEDAVALDAAMDAAIAEIQRIEDMMTSWRPSPLTRLNEQAGKGPTKVPPELAQIIARGQAMGELTGGAFDITFAGVGKLWSFKKGSRRMPGKAELAAALQHVDYRRIKVDAQANTVEIPAGMRIGLGGIAKGYAVDRAMAVLLKHKVEHGIVNAGGDLKVLGKKQGESWEIAIKHPRDRQRAMAVLKLSNTCLVSSGDYERFFEVDGKRYHHILDPRTGYPAQGCISASVLAQNAEQADALATALCVLGPDKGLQMIESLPRAGAIVVGMDGQVRASAGLRGSLLP